MSSAMINPSEELDRALHRRGDPMSGQDFLDVLREVTGGPAESLTAGERTFLLEHTDLHESDLTEQARTGTRAELFQNTLALDRTALDGALTTEQVAGLLQRNPANVRRSSGRGDLYSPNHGDPQGLRFPAWQFTEAGKVVPGLSKIIPAFPRHTHPAVIERFMAMRNEALDGSSPLHWLEGGGPPDAVVELVDELGYA